MNVTRAIVAAGIALALTACGPTAPNSEDVAACTGLKQTIAQLSKGTVGNALNQDEVMLLGWEAIAHNSKLKGYIHTLEGALALANPGAGNFSQLGYDTEDAAVKEIGQFCAGDGVKGIANGW